MNGINFYFKKISNKYLLVTLLVAVLCPILALSYSNFIVETENYNTSEMMIGNLLYSMKIDDESVNTVSVPALTEKEIIIEVTNLNTVSSKYMLMYQSNPSVRVKYAEDDNEPTYGLVITTKTFTIAITNTTETATTVSFSVAGGYSHNDVEEIAIPTGYTAVPDHYLKYDFSMLALFVNNVRVESLSNSLAYSLNSYSCNNGETITYTAAPRSLLVTPFTASTKCTLNFITIPQIVYNFAYKANDGVTTSYIQTFTAPANGQYKLEVWGGQGSTKTYTAGRGGYSVGYTTLNYGTPLYIVVAGSGASGGLNGGGIIALGSGGGGATHIATMSVGAGFLSNLSSYTSSVLIVAGGGGGGGDFNDIEGYGGGTIGGGQAICSGWPSSAGLGGTQSTGGHGNASGSFGQGGIGYGHGGGGWYGGGAGEDCGKSYSDDVLTSVANCAGGGGSGYIKSTLTNAYTYPGNTSFLSPAGASETGHTGNGYARITYISN